MGVVGHLRDIDAAFLSLDQWASIAQIVTALFSILVLAGLFFAWREYKRQAEENRIALMTGMTKYLNEVARVFVEYPQMKKYFHDGCKPGRRDRPRAEAIAVTMANAMDHVLTYLDRAGDAEQSAWESYFDHVYENSPTLRRYLQENRGWYGPRLRDRFGLADPL